MNKIFAGLAMAFGIAAGAAETAEACTSSQINMRQRADVAIDANTGTLLYGMNENTPFYQASLTKRMVQLMAYEALQNGSLTKEQRIDLPRNYFRNASGEPQYADAIPFNYTSVSVEDAITAMMLRSSNRAPFALARAIGGTEENFVAMMNTRAAQLGMSQSHFVNPAGYPTAEAERAHRTTAMDHAKLVREIVTKFPEEVENLSRLSASLTGYTNSGRAGNFTVQTTNALMPGRNSAYSLSYVSGGKTGYACAAGPAIDVEAEIGGRTVIVVTGGHDNAAERNRTAYNILTERGALFMARLEHSREVEQQQLAMQNLEMLFGRPEPSPFYRSFTYASYKPYSYDHLGTASRPANFYGMTSYLGYQWPAQNPGDPFAPQKDQTFALAPDRFRFLNFSPLSSQYQ